MWLLAMLLSGALIVDAERRLHEDGYEHLQLLEGPIALGIALCGLTLPI